MRVGTPEHRDLFCRTFIEGHVPYEPENLPWPNLEPKYLERLRSLPFWGIARAMEQRAGMMVTSFARTLDDPVIREAVALQGVEESRHARIMNHLIERYALPVREVDMPTHAPVKDRFVGFGYEECVDFFMGAGLFNLATKIDMFPADLVAIFENVIFEEARHVTFFINWYRYEEARAGRDGALERYVTAFRNYAASIRQLVRSFAGADTTGFAASNANGIIEGMTPIMFLEAALAENRRLLGLLDHRLIKPGLLPVLATVTLTLLRALPPRPDAHASPVPAQAPAGALDAHVAA